MYLNQTFYADLSWLANFTIQRKKKADHLLVPTMCHVLLHVREVL